MKVSSGGIKEEFSTMICLVSPLRMGAESEGRPQQKVSMNVGMRLGNWI